MKASRSHGTRSRRAIVEAGLDLWGPGGRAAVTIATLADRLGMSKAGVFSAFGSKDALDLAIVEAAAERLGRDVVAPASLAPEGIARLAALVEGWLGEVESRRSAIRVLIDRPPPTPPELGARLRAWRDSWQSTLARHIGDAVRLGELPAGASAAQVAFEVDALLVAALRGTDAADPTAIASARRGVESRLRRLATGD